MKQGNGPVLKLVPFIGASILALSACDVPSEEPEYVGVCVHPVTEVRLDDDACGDYDDEGHASHSGGMFVWVSHTSNVPLAPVGSKQITSNTARTLPAGKLAAKGVDKAGATSVKSQVQRGGLGIKGVSGNAGKGSSGS